MFIHANSAPPAADTASPPATDRNFVRLIAGGMAARVPKRL
jgi:hypothetical protein